MTPQTSFLLLWLTLAPPPEAHRADYPWPQLPTAQVCRGMVETANTEAAEWEQAAALTGQPAHHRAAKEARRVADCWVAAHFAAHCWATGNWCYCDPVGGMLDAEGWAEHLHALIGERAMILGNLPLPLSLRR